MSMVWSGTHLVKLHGQHADAPVSQLTEAIDGIQLLLGGCALRKHCQALPCLCRQTPVQIHTWCLHPLLACVCSRC